MPPTRPARPAQPDIEYPELALEIKPSTIPGAGLGLFAIKRYEPAEDIVEYTGEIIGPAEVLTRYALGTRHSAYIMQVSGKRYIDAHDPDRSSMARYANDGRRESRNNAEAIVMLGRRVMLVAKWLIEPGDEILFSYGTQYWALHDRLGGHDVPAPRTRKRMKASSR